MGTVRWFAIGLLCGLASLAVQGVWAGDDGDAEFSADTFQSGGQGKAVQGKMYVSKGRTRIEMEQGGQKMVRIMDPKNGVAYILMPDQQAYLEQRGPARETDEPGDGEPRDDKPCAGMQGVSCRKLGSEDVHGRPADQWEFIAEHEGQKMRSVQWIDKERGIPLRWESTGGQVMEFRMLAEEEVNGRAVEKWERTSQRGGGSPSRSYQWYDPKLEIAIREEFGEGQVRELKNIVEGPQSDELFQVPQGYKKMEMPSRSPQR